LYKFDSIVRQTHDLIGERFFLPRIFHKHVTGVFHVNHTDFSGLPQYLKYQQDFLRLFILSTVATEMSNLKLIFDSDEDQKIEILKREFGIKQTTELIRFLLTSKCKEIQNRNSS